MVSSVQRRAGKIADGARSMYSIRKAQGTVDTTASVQPFTNVAPPSSSGYPFGYLADGGGRFHFDSLQWQRDGVVGGPVFIVVSDKGGAKSTLLKELGMLMSNTDVGNGRPARTGAAIVRRNAGVNEWDAFAEFFGVEPIPMHNAGLNPLSRGTKLPVNYRIEWLIDAFEHTGHALSLEETFVLSAAMVKMYEQVKGDPVFKDLFDLITQFNADAENEYYLSALELDEFDDKMKDLLSADFDAEELAQARRSLRRRMSLFLKGGLGGVFGSKQPLEAVLTQDQQIHDYSMVAGTARAAIPLLQSLIMDVRYYAAMTNNYDLTVEYEPYDETNTLLRYPITAKRLLNMVKVIRGLQKVVGLAIHRLQDIEAIGEHDSELRGIVVDLLEEVEIAFIGKLKGPRARRMVAEWKDLSKGTMRGIAGQGTGDFCVLVADRDPLFIYRPLNDTLQTISESNQANRGKLTPTPQ